MSNYTPQPNTFSLFANDKGDNPKRPDYKGDIILPDGTKMRLSAWVRESKAASVISQERLSLCRSNPTLVLLHLKMVTCHFSVPF